MIPGLESLRDFRLMLFGGFVVSMVALTREATNAEEFLVGSACRVLVYAGMLYATWKLETRETK